MYWVSQAQLLLLETIENLTREQTKKDLYIRFIPN